MFSFATAILFTLSAPISAQWLNYLTPGIPRNADGTPNLAGPPPRAANGKPELSGLWRINTGLAYSLNIVADLRPDETVSWAADFYRQRVESLAKDYTETQCLPLGIQRTLRGFAKIIQTPSLIVLLFEDLSYRQIFLDDRGLPQAPNPSFMGYSVGHWDDDTLVVESTGYNDRTWLDLGGHPHTESMQITERWHRKSFGQIDLQVRFEDPSAYTRSWTVPVNIRLAPDTELLEAVCNENEKDRAHFQGPRAEKKVTLSPEVLPQYAGVFESEGPIRSLQVTFSNGQLFSDFDGKGHVPLIPVGEAQFSFGPDVLEFLKDDHGNVTEARFAATGRQRFTRKQ